MAAHEYEMNDPEPWHRSLHEAQKEIALLRWYVERIEQVSNHYAMTPTYSERVLRYAHKSTRNLARAALKGGDDERA